MYQRVMNYSSFPEKPEDSVSISSSTFSLLPSHQGSRSSPERVFDKSLDVESPQSNGTSPFSILKWWIPELAASFCSVLALLAIVVVLRVYENRALDDLHMPSFITLNGLIAAISTFDRVFLAIPIGSALSQEAWLWFYDNSKLSDPTSRIQDLTLSDSASRGAWGSFLFIFFCRRRWLALVGALITVLSLSITTFTQQLVSIESLPITDSNSPLSPGNIPRSEIYNGTGSQLLEQNYGPPLNVLAPVNEGFFAENVSPIAPTCLTGNCTFPDTPTLAVCGSCAPITFRQTSCDSQHHTCNYTTPSGSQFSILKFDPKDPSDGTGVSVTTTNGQHWNASSTDTLYLANWDMMYYPYGYTGFQSVDAPLAATECALWMCVNTYRTTVQSGMQQQQLISSYSNISPSVKPQTYQFSLPRNGSLPSGEFLVDATTFFNLQGAFTGKLVGTVTIGLYGYLSDKDNMIALWNSTTFLEQWMGRFTTTMSNHVRTTHPVSALEYDGTGHQLGVVVRWGWLALPVAMVAMSVVLLCVVIAKTASREVKSWKASPLTLLLLDVDGAIRKDALEAGWPDTFDAAENGVGPRGVVLKRKGDGGWYLRGA